jgi:hypothetical protein
VRTLAALSGTARRRTNILAASSGRHPAFYSVIGRYLSGAGRCLADYCGVMRRKGRIMSHKPKLFWFVRPTPSGVARSVHAMIRINVFDERVVRWTPEGAARRRTHCEYTFGDCRFNLLCCSVVIKRCGLNVKKIVQGLTSITK